MATTTRSESRAWEPDPPHGVESGEPVVSDPPETADADQAAIAAFAAAWVRSPEETETFGEGEVVVEEPDPSQSRHHVRTSGDYATQPGLPGRGVIVGSTAAAAGVILLDFTLTGGLSMFFGLWFVVICLIGAMAVRRQDLFTTGVLAPLLFGALIALISLVAPSTFSDVGGFGKVFPTGLTAHAGALVAGYGVALLTVGARAANKS